MKYQCYVELFWATNATAYKPTRVALLFKKNKKIKNTCPRGHERAESNPPVLRVHLFSATRLSY